MNLASNFNDFLQTFYDQRRISGTSQNAKRLFFNSCFFALQPRKNLNAGQFNVGQQRNISQKIGYSNTLPTNLEIFVAKMFHGLRNIQFYEKIHKIIETKSNGRNLTLTEIWKPPLICSCHKMRQTGRN